LSAAGHGCHICMRNQKMEIPLARKIAGKKYLWDGTAYVTQDDARQAMEAYQKDGFDVHLVLEGDRYLVYSRRVATVQAAT
jgi:hypothetical protein